MCVGFVGQGFLTGGGVFWSRFFDKKAFLKNATIGWLCDGLQGH